MFEKHRMFEFRSPEQAWVTGGKGTKDFEGWVENKGPGGGRTIIAGFWLHFAGNVTVATAAFLGKDKPRLFRSVTVEQKDNVKRWDDMPGDAIQILNYQLCGETRMHEMPDTAASTADIYASIYVPMAKPRAYSPLDFSMAADVFKVLKIGLAQNSDVSQGTSAVTINSGRYWVIAECYEEADVVAHAVDTISIRDFDATSETKLNFSGKLADLVIYAPGAAGGQAFSDVQDVRVKELMQEAFLVYPDLALRYERRHENANNLQSSQGAQVRRSPYAPNATFDVQAISVIDSSGAKSTEGPELDGVHVVTSPQTATGSAHTGTLRCIMRVLERRSDKLERAVAKKFQAKGGRVKPAKSSATTPAPAPKDHAFLPAQLLK